jgi:hypothetical protein
MLCRLPALLLSSLLATCQAPPPSFSAQNTSRDGPSSDFKRTGFTNSNAANIPVSFYVSPFGDDNYRGTFERPFLSLAKCQSAMRRTSTKTCTVRAGTYRFSTTLKFTSADNNEIWQYYPPDGVATAILDGGGSGMGTNTGVDIFLLQGTSGITLNGLKCQNFNVSCVHTEGGKAFGIGCTTNLTVKNMDAGYNTMNMPKGIQSIIGLEGCTIRYSIQNNYLHDAGSGCLVASTYNSSSDAISGIFQDNVCLRFCQIITDCGGIGTDMHSGFIATAGTVVIKNNYIADGGSSSATRVAGIYLDDYSNHVFLISNVVAPPNPASPRGDAGGQADYCIEQHNGSYNIAEYNICDLGTTADEDAVLWFFDNNPPIGVSKQTGEVFTNNIVIMNFRGSLNLGGAICNAKIYCQNSGAPGDYTIKNNNYFNYGDGRVDTTGPVADDTNPIIQNPKLTCTDGVYSIDPESPALHSPMNFPKSRDSWGFPGFSLPLASISHSC